MQRFLNLFIYFRPSTCFKRFLLQSSGANNCTYTFRYCKPILLLAATVEEIALVPSPPEDGTSAISSTAAARYVLLMMGGKAA